MPQELPGFYYDAEKNRYFPLKGPIPGSSRASSSTANAQKPCAKDTRESNACTRPRKRISKLIQARELHGNVITSKKGKHNFMQEYLEFHVSQPVVWKYQETNMIGNSALEQVHTHVHTPEGAAETDILITGSVNGSLSFFQVGKVGEHFVNGVKCIPDRVWPFSEEDRADRNRTSPPLWRSAGASIQLSSAISCIKLCGKYLHMDDSLPVRQALITTLGSEACGGSVSLLDLAEPLDFHSTTLRRMMHETACLNCTIWTADSNPNKRQAVIGTNLGSALVDFETGRTLWVCRSKSDVLAQQFDQSGNAVLCGYRNGAIVTVDTREKQERSSARLIRHRIPYSSQGRHGRNSIKQWFELKGNIYPSCTIYMTSSVCCLVPLRLYDQYFLASSMDGSIKLYDHRMTKRGFVQSYEGHVNSHTRSQLGIDHSERFLISGGEDGKLRLWSLVSGEMLFEERVSQSFLSTVCWGRSEGIVKTPDESKSSMNLSSGDNLSRGAWFGSQEGLFQACWS